MKYCLSQEKELKSTECNGMLHLKKKKINKKHLLKIKIIGKLETIAIILVNIEVQQ